MSHRIKSLSWLGRGAMAGALALAACGVEGPRSEANAPDPAFRDALAAEAERYVNLQEQRAAQADAVDTAFRHASAAEAERYVELQQRRAAQAARTPDTRAGW